MDRGAWWAPVHGVAKSQTRLRDCWCLLAKSHLTLCNPVDWSPPGSFVHGILQGRELKWVPIPSSKGSSQPGDGTHISDVYLHRQVGSLPLAPSGKPRKPGWLSKSRGPQGWFLLGALVKNSFPPEWKSCLLQLLEGPNSPWFMTPPSIFRAGNAASLWCLVFHTYSSLWLLLGNTLCSEGPGWWSWIHLGGPEYSLHLKVYCLYPLWEDSLFHAQCQSHRFHKCENLWRPVFCQP